MIKIIVVLVIKEIVIGFDQLFCVIGEWINLIGCKKLVVEMVEGNFEIVKVDVLVQVVVGVIMFDVNVGVMVVNLNEMELLFLVKIFEIV